MTITKEGALASFYTVNKAPIKHLKVYFSPKQAGSGDASPENVREISGWNNITTVHTGKNLIISDDPTNLEKTYTHTSTGSTLYDASTQSVYSQGNGVSHLRHWNTQMNTAGNDCLFIAPDNITVSYSINISHDNTQDFTSWPIRLMKNGEQWSYYRRDKDSSASNLCHKRENVQLSKNDCLTGTFYGGVYWKNLQIEIGPEATKYEPYRGQTHTLDWTDEVGTVYGGYVDLVTGELVQEYTSFTFDENTQLNFAYNSFQELSTRIYTVVPLVHDTTADCYVSNASSGAIFDGTMRWYRQGIKEFNLYIPTELTGITSEDTNDSATTKIKAFLANNPTQYVYKLATPITHQLTPTTLQTLIGRNNIWSNADRVEVEYDLAESNDELYRRRNILLRSAPHIEAASGNIAHFETGLVAPIKSAIVRFSPIQEGSGDPSPENVRAISGWTGVKVYKTGKNLWGGEALKTALINVMPVTSVSNNIVTYSNDSAAQHDGDILFDNFKQNTQYTLILTYSKNTNVYCHIKFVYSDGSFDLMRILNLSPDTKGTCAFVSKAGKTLSKIVRAADEYSIVTMYCDECGLFEGVLTASDFKSYSGTMLPIDWSTEAGTIYGGYVDLATGELISNWKYVTLNGTQNAYISGTSYRGNANTDVWFDVSFGYTTSYAQNISKNDTQCDSLNLVSQAIWGYPDTYPWHYVLNSYNQVHCVFDNATVGIETNDTNADAIAKIRAWLAINPINIAIRTGTPQATYSLSPTQLKALKGTNNIWSNANGTIEVKYWRH